MSEFFKISGKKVALPSQSSKKWKFQVRPGGWIIAESESGIRKRMMIHEAKGKVSAHLEGYLWFGEKGIEAASQEGAGGDSDLTAQFPGKVRKILVTPGSEVILGDSLILVEAMKMEFAIRAPFSGKVQKILVTEGQQLSPGDRFLDLEAVKNGE